MVRGLKVIPNVPFMAVSELSGVILPRAVVRRDTKIDGSALLNRVDMEGLV